MQVWRATLAISSSRIALKISGINLRSLVWQASFSSGAAKLFMALNTIFLTINYTSEARRVIRFFERAMP